MKELYDVWPFDLDSGPEFLFLYALLSFIAFGIGWFATELVGAIVERAKSPRVAPTPVAESLDAYRSPAGLAARRPLARGTLPGPEDIWAIAWLRNRDVGVAEALMAAAVASGWIRSNGKSLTVSPGSLPTDPVFMDFHTALSWVNDGSYLGIRRAALGIAQRHAPELRTAVASAGLERSKSMRMLVSGLIAAVGASMLFVGVVRCERARELHRPHGFLVLEMAALTVVTYVVARRRWESRSQRANQYLSWLGDATTSLRQDVVAGRRTSSEEVASTAAISGLTALATAPLFLDISTRLFLGTSLLTDASSSNSSSSSSTCSSSSCSSSSCSSSSCSSSSSGCGG